MNTYILIETVIDGLVNSVKTVRSSMDAMNQYKAYKQFGDNMVDKFEDSRAEIRAGTVITRGEQASDYGVGNCGEFALALQAEVMKKLPCVEIAIVGAVPDHAFCIVSAYCVGRPGMTHFEIDAWDPYIGILDRTIDIVTYNMQDFGTRKFKIKEFVTGFQKGMGYERSDNKKNKFRHFSEDAKGLKVEYGRYKLGESIYGYLDIPKRLESLPDAGNKIIKLYKQQYASNTVGFSEKSNKTIGLDYKNEGTAFLPGLKVLLISMHQYEKDLDSISECLSLETVITNMKMMSYMLRGSTKISSLWTDQKFDKYSKATGFKGNLLMSLIIGIRSLFCSLIAENGGRDVFRNFVAHSVVESNLGTLDIDNLKTKIGCNTLKFFAENGIEIVELFNLMRYVLGVFNEDTLTEEKAQLRAGVYYMFSILPGLASTIDNYEDPSRVNDKVLLELIRNLINFRGGHYKNYATDGKGRVTGLNQSAARLVEIEEMLEVGTEGSTVREVLKKTNLLDEFFKFLPGGLHFDESLKCGYDELIGGVPVGVILNMVIADIDFF